MIETLIICFLALAVGIIIAAFLVLAYSSLWGYMALVLTFTKYFFFWVFLILLLLVTGFVSGVYPALYVSSFSPVTVFKGSSPFRGAGKLSSVLLALQFSISVMALVLGLVFSKNAVYQRTLDLGYDRDNLIVMPVPVELSTSFRNEILSNPKIISVAGTQEHIGFGAYPRPVKDAVKQLEVEFMDIGPEYAATMGLRLIEGRLFDKLREGADRANKSIIINQKMVEDFGWKTPLGMTITLYDTTKLTVIGVVENFYTNGIWEKIHPTVLRLTSKDDYRVLVVRAEPTDLHDVLDYLSVKWKSQGTNFIFGAMFQENTLNEEKTINNSILKVNVFLAVAATLLSLIGMYNLVSLDVIRRTKEMGIRKIQGASVPLIMYLVSRKFLIILVLASLVGCWGGYYMSNMLMDSIWDYFVEIKPGVLILSASIMFVATVLTIIFKIGKAALRNPVDSLRYE
jgi:ABC-type antimicrobial peptide transport system permease subunit